MQHLADASYGSVLVVYPTCVIVRALLDVLVSLVESGKGKNLVHQVGVHNGLLGSFPLPCVTDVLALGKPIVCLDCPMVDQLEIASPQVCLLLLGTMDEP